MKEIAPDVWHIQCLPALPYAVNAFLVDDVLIDAGARQSGKRILKQLGDRKLSTPALTHAHPDHQGASKEVCEALEIPFWVPDLDVPAAEDPALIRERQPPKAMARFFYRIFVGPGHPVDKPLKEGDSVGSFEVVDAPGHSAGQVAFWRDSDKVLILGDVLANMDQYTGIPGLNEPKPTLTPDPARNRESARKLAKLEPELICFGHGKPLDDGEKFAEFVGKLPED
jgi:glyoxylase-like metal-dependent hydrolase (beta-lactamase superfamily II)